MPDPVVINEIPAVDATGVDQQPVVIFDLIDTSGSGIDTSATKIWVNGIVVWQSAAAQSPWTGAAAVVVDGYRYSLFSPGIFSGLSIVMVNVYGKDNDSNYVNTSWEFAIGPEAILDINRSVPIDRAQFIGAIDLPYRYGSDLQLTGDERAIENNMRNSVMIQRGMIPLRNDLGSRVPLLPFDPNDDVLREEIIAEAERAIAVGEPRATVDQMVRIYESEDNRAQMVISWYPNSFVDSESRLLTFPVAKLDE
jgi:phage baseplate assembly protein W